jgi:hypothetical protein
MYQSTATQAVHPDTNVLNGGSIESWDSGEILARHSAARAGCLNTQID